MEIKDMEITDMTYTTLDTLTDDQITALRDESAAAGDMAMAAICDVALIGELDRIVDTEDQLAALDRLGIIPGRSGATLRARAEIVRVIRDAEAQVDDDTMIEDAQSEQIRHGSFGPIVWDTVTCDTRVATQHDMDTLPVGPDLTDEEEAGIEEH